jgi:DNA-binding transcriptional LysR family regulator
MIIRAGASTICDSRGVELRHFEYFVAVAEELSFTRAAARLHVVQSGVSAVIRGLEADLGAPLFERSSKRVELTDAGVAFLPRARAALDAAIAARDAVDEVLGGLRGRLRIGTMAGIDLIDIPALLGRFHRESPGVTVQLVASPHGSRSLVESVANGSLHLAFVSIPLPAPASVTLRELASFPLRLVLPAWHALATRPSVSLADLADEIFIDYPDGYGNRAVVDRAFNTVGLRRHVSVEVADITAGAHFVRHDLGVAILPSFVIPDHPDLRIVPIRDTDLRWTMSVATSSLRSVSAATRALLKLLDDPADSGTSRPNACSPPGRGVI